MGRYIHVPLTSSLHHTVMNSLKIRLRAFGLHLGLSLAVAILAAGLVFGLWYPYHYREVSGGRELFLLLMGVDVVMGPTITFLLFNPLKKKRRELMLDCTLIGLLQVAALCYGLWSVSVARPVHLVFEYNRFSVAHANQVPDPLLGRVPPGIVALPWTGPTLLSLRSFHNEQERLDATMAALQGMALAGRVDLWQPYADAREAVLSTSRPLLEFKQRFPHIVSQADDVLKRADRSWERGAYLPLVGRKVVWTVVIDNQSAEILGFLPVDPF